MTDLAFIHIIVSRRAPARVAGIRATPRLTVRVNTPRVRDRLLVLLVLLHLERGAVWAYVMAGVQVERGKAKEGVGASARGEGIYPAAVRHSYDAGHGT